MISEAQFSKNIIKRAIPYIIGATIATSICNYTSNDNAKLKRLWWAIPEGVATIAILGSTGREYYLLGKENDKK